MNGVNNAQRGRSWLNPRPTDMFIALMGVTGVGKSSFVSLCSSQRVEIGHRLQACTQQVGMYSFEYNATTTVYLIDTPGFDDTSRSDTEVLREIATWLADSYSNKIQLNGIIYLHRITDVRMQGSAQKNLLLFKKLCGPNALKNVILGTTMWDKISLEDGEARENELAQTPEFWGWMKSKGSKILRHHNTLASAMKLVEFFYQKSTTVLLELQQQMVDERKPLDQTDAGKQLESAIAKERERFQEMLREAQEQMHEALALRDMEAMKAIKEIEQSASDNIRRLQKDTEGLKISVDELYQSKFARIEQDRKEAQKEAENAKKLRRGANGDVTVMQKQQGGSEQGAAQEGAFPAELAPSSQPGSPAKRDEISEYSVSLSNDDDEGDCYVLQGPKKNQWKLPRSCKPDGWKKIIQIELGQWASWVAIYLDKEGKRCKAKSPDFHIAYPRVWERILEREAEVGPLEYISLGVDSHYFVRFFNGYSWDLPTAQMGFNVKEECRRIKSLALGRADSYVLTRVDGTFHWNLRGQYPLLTTFLA